VTSLIDSYVADQHALLERLAAFSGTSDYSGLLDFVRRHCPGAPELWFAEWLITPAVSFNDNRPIDIAAQPGGVDLLMTRLARLIHGNGGVS
jgi:hypothetical protein